MLSLVAVELANQYFPNLDTGLIAQFSTVHDLIELETRDIPTYTLDAAGLSAKETAEAQSLATLARKLPPHTRSLLIRYEAQTEPEARFVRLVDKILPVIVDIAGAGYKIMVEDYGITTTSVLEEVERRLSTRLRQQFPEPELHFLHLVRDLLATDFTTSYTTALAEAQHRPAADITV